MFAATQDLGSDFFTCERQLASGQGGKPDHVYGHVLCACVFPSMSHLLICLFPLS